MSDVIETREIQEEKIQEVYEAVHSLIASFVTKGEILNTEIVYGALTAMVECTDDGSERFVDFIDAALDEVIYHIDLTRDGVIH